MAGNVFTNPTGAMGQAKTFSAFGGEYVAAAAITQGQVLTFNVSGQVLPATTGVSTGLQAGVAMETVASGHIVQVCHIGLQYVLSDTGVTAGMALSRSGTNPGQVVGATITAGGTIGFAIQAVSADKSGYVLAFINPTVIKVA